ncbi:MAG: GntR family transcriptional regulator [Candidatus Dormibacteria bacterium]
MFTATVTLDHISGPGPTKGPDPLLKAVSHRSLSDEVSDRLREAIVTGALRPGERLREVEISAALQVSRSPVRDAFSQLGHEGLVSVRSHRGAVVVGMSARDVEEVYTLRASLETLAVRLTIARASDQAIEKLRESVAQNPDPTVAPNARDYAEHDVRLHDLIYQMAEHERLYTCWTTLSSHIFRFLLSRNLVNPDFAHVNREEHGELVETIAERDTERAVAMTTVHIQGAYARLIAGYAEPSPGVASALTTPRGRSQPTSESGAPPQDS